MIEITIRELKDAWLYDIKGINKGGGEGAKKKTEEYTLIELIAEVIVNHKVKIERR